MLHQNLWYKQVLWNEPTCSTLTVLCPRTKPENVPDVTQLVKFTRVEHLGGMKS